MLLEDLSLRKPGLEIRVSRDPKFEKNRKNDVFMHIIPPDSVLTTQMHFSPTHLVPLLLSTLFGGLASKLSLKINHDTKVHCKSGNKKTYFTLLSSWMNQVPGRLFFFCIYESIALATRKQNKNAQMHWGKCAR